MEWQVEYYETVEGRIPLRVWIDGLRNVKGRERILDRLERLEHGNLGSHRSVGHGICELKIDHGPGYRVYFARRGTTIGLLLCGGDKSTQPKDVVQAYWYWSEYRRRHE